MDIDTKGLEKAQTGRYIYHLTCKSRRESISEFGFDIAFNRYSRKETNFIFAHNTNRVGYNWYWICFDSYEFRMWDYYTINKPEIFITERDELRYCVNTYYDIWQIDNAIANKDWYIDMVGWDDMKPEQKDMYVKCIGNIPKEALTLCHLEIDLIEDVKTEFTMICKTYKNQIISRIEFEEKYGIIPEQEFSDKGEMYDYVLADLIEKKFIIENEKSVKKMNYLKYIS